MKFELLDVAIKDHFSSTGTIHRFLFFTIRRYHDFHTLFGLEIYPGFIYLHLFFKEFSIRRDNPQF